MVKILMQFRFTVALFLTDCFLGGCEVLTSSKPKRLGKRLYIFAPSNLICY